MTRRKLLEEVIMAQYFRAFSKKKLPVAVKRTLRDFKDSSEENEIISKIGNHQEFLLRYFCMEKDENFEYIKLMESKIKHTIK